MQKMFSKKLPITWKRFIDHYQNNIGSENDFVENKKKRLYYQKRVREQLYIITNQKLNEKGNRLMVFIPEFDINGKLESLKIGKAWYFPQFIEHFLGVLSNQKLSNSAILAQSSEQRSYSIQREPDAMALDQEDQFEDSGENVQDPISQNNSADNSQQYVQEPESSYQNTEQDNNNDPIDTKQQDDTQQAAQEQPAYEKKQEEEYHAQDVPPSNEITSDENQETLVDNKQTDQNKVDNPNFEEVAEDSDPTVLKLAPRKEEEKESNKEKKSFWRHVSKETESLNSGEGDSQNMIATKVDDSLGDDEQSTTLQMLPQGISKEQFLAMMPVERDLLLYPITIDSYQSSTDIDNLGLSEADILKEMATSYDPTQDDITTQ